MAQRILLYDKSTFHAIPSKEAIYLQILFCPTLAPTLVYEVLADLTRARERGTPSQFVRSLARKFGGSGPPINVDYQTLVRSELLTGSRVPMTGQIIPAGMRIAPVTDGKPGGAIIDLTEFNKAIFRWHRGEFLISDYELALRWRASTRHFSLLGFKKELHRRRLDLRRPKTDADLIEIVDQILGDPSHHEAWLLYFLTELAIDPRTVVGIRRRWQATVDPNLSTFSPYTFFCLRALLLVLVLWVHRLTKSEPNNLIDVQYLYYLPFCEIFSSGDSLHRRVAPLLLRPDQLFLSASDLFQQIRAYRDQRAPARVSNREDP